MFDIAAISGSISEVKQKKYQRGAECSLSRKLRIIFLIDASLDEIDTLYGAILFLNCKYCPKFKETLGAPEVKCSDTSYCDGIKEKFDAVLSKEETDGGYK